MPVAAADAPSNVRGTIVSKTATVLMVRTANATVSVALTPKTGYASATTGSLADIKPGTFVGIASAPDGGSSKALEVAVFPESMRGAGEGDYPWDLPVTGSHSAMTNGAVAQPSHKTSMMTNGSIAKSSHKTSMMTNGSVAKSSGGGTSVTLMYKGGSRVIMIPPNATIVKLAPGSSALLATNAHVFVKPMKSGAGLTAAFVVVGENGTIPPM